MSREAPLAPLGGLIAALAVDYALLRAWPEVTHVVLEAARLGARYVVTPG